MNGVQKVKIMDMEWTNENKLQKYIVTYYNVNPVTFKRIRTQAIVNAYDEDHAKRVIDRHPSLIKSVKSVK